MQERGSRVSSDGQSRHSRIAFFFIEIDRVFTNLPRGLRSEPLEEEESRGGELRAQTWQFETRDAYFPTGYDIGRWLSRGGEQGSYI